MRRWLLLASVIGVLSAHGQSERINSFHTDLTVAPDGQLTVTEEITIHAEGDQFKRGIVRKLPLRFQDHNGRQHRVTYELSAVEIFGATSPYHTATEGDDFLLYVGSEGNFLEPGDYPYRITYTTKGQVGFFTEYDEIYWNVSGNGWDFPIDSISATIHLPASAQVKQTACYTGSFGSTERNCTDSINDAHTVTFQGRALQNYEGLTVAVGFQKGVVAEPPPPTFFELHAVALVGGGITLLLLLYYFVTWKRFGRDPDIPTVIPLFEPPDGLSPASVGMVMEGGFENRLITPAMIDLAVKGLIRIDEKKEDHLLGLITKETYTIVRLKGATGLPKEEDELYTRLFNSVPEGFVFDGTYDPRVQSMAAAFKSTLTTQWNTFLNKGNNVKFWLIPILLVVVCVIALVVLANMFWGDRDAVYIVVFVVANLILLIFYIYLIKKPSLEKQALRSRLLGFKMYLSAAEEKQLQHFNPPTMTPEIFEKYLPYAIAFKVEKIWGDRFQDLIANALIDKSYHPGWYSGSIMNYGAFSQHMNSSLSSSVSSSSTPPSSSGGSGGGGSSGGGGGGGGGGGW
ncbi:MAG: DUF2207 domain-containing protein [Flavobacteriales bacterium]|nr:DUF2207 domain-containing protein [Flavobacteriales bacterium]MBK6945486.1 DUF2207 domain-containing protein [Flavobacteriales bacterium]MBK7241599.1 DUF2207 domain-containing protein [Flavobacteriales bacterium]MBK9534960.1 DUF2207 domain-containing protein [Flavobacteriales bacterium]MBP9138471.1 DUF2207 domain-containing protein [Flavobacteriales bacterium]